MEFRRILVACTGNICRSPMGEYMLRERLGGVTVESAGIGALVGAPADPHAVTVMAERGVDLGTHRGRQLDLELAQGFDLMLVMEHEQQSWIEGQFPVLRGRVLRLGHWSDEDIADPYRRSIEDFREARDRIEFAVEQWVGRLEGKE